MKTLLFLLASFSVAAQDLPCAPPIGEEPKDIAYLKTAITDTQTLTIPIVFTVLYFTDAQNAAITDALLHDQIRIMTEDFQAINSDRLTVVPPFNSIIGNTKFRFCLKEIRRIRTTTENFTAFIDNFDPAKGGVPAVDPLRNCNIYFTNIQYAGGQSIFPNVNTVGRPYDANIIRMQSFLGNGKRINTHELGHWFGLPHTFNGGCTHPGDGIDDTPPTLAASSTAGACPTTFAPCGQVANVQNHMDYSNCRVMFTQGQSIKMRSIAFTLRMLLWSEGSCGAAPDSPPVVTITSPTPNQNFTAPATITMSANATDDKGITKVEFFTNNQLFATDNTAPYSFIWNNAPAGNHTITVKAYDAIQSSQANVSVIVNPQTNTPPQITLTSPLPGEYTAPAAITLAATASDNGQVTRVEFYINNTPIADYVAPYSVSLGGLPAGTYRIYAKAIDNLGASTSTNQITITVVAQQAGIPVTKTTIFPPNQVGFEGGGFKIKVTGVPY